QQAGTAAVWGAVAGAVIGGIGGAILLGAALTAAAPGIGTVGGIIVGGLGGAAVGAAVGAGIGATIGGVSGAVNGYNEGLQNARWHNDAVRKNGGKPTVAPVSDQTLTLDPVTRQVRASLAALATPTAAQATGLALPPQADKAVDDAKRAFAGALGIPVPQQQAAKRVVKPGTSVKRSAKPAHRKAPHRHPVR
ncbi:MAG: hypothetical protein QM634_04260, partial [Gordonia sp. (in: high G+C Gram-positive bacteria)]